MQDLTVCKGRDNIYQYGVVEAAEMEYFSVIYGSKGPASENF